MRAATHNERVFQVLLEKYPDMTIGELVQQRRLAAENIRQAMRALGYQMPDDDEALWKMVRDVGQHPVDTGG